MLHHDIDALIYSVVQILPFPSEPDDKSVIDKLTRFVIAACLRNPFAAQMVHFQRTDYPVEIVNVQPLRRLRQGF